MLSSFLTYSPSTVILFHEYMGTPQLLASNRWDVSDMIMAIPRLSSSSMGPIVVCHLWYGGKRTAVFKTVRFERGGWYRQTRQILVSDLSHLIVVEDYTTI